MRIVVTEPNLMAAEVRAQLADLGSVVYGPFDDRTLFRELADANVLMVRLGRRVDAKLLDHAPHLRAIVSATTGLDHIDIAAAAAAGVRVISLRDCMDLIRNVSATAEHALGLMLALVRHTPSAHTHVVGGGWNRDLFWGSELRGKRLGILGFGRIGAMVARYGVALGMDVAAFDVDPERIAGRAQSLSFDNLLSTSDVVSVHVTAIADNRHLIDAAAIRRMKAGAFLINTSRGFIVDELALAQAVSSGHLSGVAVDVLEDEVQRRIEASALLACARAGHNVLITPHVGGATREAIAQAEGAVVTVLAAFVSPQLAEDGR